MAPTNSTIKASKNKPMETLVFPESSGSHGMMFLFRDYAYKTPGTFELLKRANIVKKGFNTITLPIPGNLSDNNEMRMSRSDLGLKGDLIATKTRDLSSVTDGKSDIYSFVSGYMDDMPFNGKDVANTLTNGDTKVAKDALYLLRNVSANDIGRNVNIGAGSTPNPRSALSFEGTEFKTHSFQWNLMPRNERESDVLNKIVNLIKRMQLPSYGGDSIERLYLKYPKTVDIFLLGVNEDYFSKYKTGMIRSFTVNPTSNGGLSILKGGKPASIMIDMTIMEMDIHTEEDYTS